MGTDDFNQNITKLKVLLISSRKTNKLINSDVINLAMVSKDRY